MKKVSVMILGKRIVDGVLCRHIQLNCTPQKLSMVRAAQSRFHCNISECYVPTDLLKKTITIIVAVVVWKLVLSCR